MTPGVYIEEVNAFPGSVVEVATAIPAFIGYTATASDKGKSLVNQPKRISSLKEYNEFFGGGFKPKFKLTKPIPKGAEPKHKMIIGSDEIMLEYKDNNEHFFYNSLRLFFANGGSACYIVSVNTFDKEDGAAIDKDELLVGLDTLLKEQEPTIIVIPDAVNLPSLKSCYEVYTRVLAHCGKMQNRVAILDVFEGFKNIEDQDDDGNVIKKFRDNIGTWFLSYAAAYYPWLHTDIVSDSEISFLNIGVDEKVSLDILAKILPEKEAIEIIEDFPMDDAALEAKFRKEKRSGVDDKKEEALKNYSEGIRQNLHRGLLATSPTYKRILDKLRKIVNLLPPSSALAGVYTMVDNSRGVWKSPANISLNGVITPAVNITHDEQENFNVDAVSGKSINAIRTFPGIGTLVWGARTLDGNSLDWKYINVRRTMIMLEQSIKLALRAYVFEPNDANTWVTAKSMIVNFLTEKWKQGALAGSSPEDSFDVQIGLGSTMTCVDILEGRMLVSVKLAIVRPAEFIIVTFEQQMQKS